MAYTLAELAKRVGGEVVGDGTLLIERVNGLDEAGPGDLSFYSNKRYRKSLEATRAGAVVVELGESAPGKNLIRAANSYLAFVKISALFNPPAKVNPGVSPEAHVDPAAKVDPSAQVMPFAWIGPGAVVGARTLIHPGVYVGEQARIGDDCQIYPQVVIREACVVGNRVILQPGCVIGSDGFGYAFDPAGEGGPQHRKFPQVGNVVVEDDVELGANTCADRAAMGSTVIGRGSKVDNLVQIAHNVRVGPLSILCAQVGISGSTQMGTGVVAGGQVGVVGHLKIGDGVKMAAQSGIMKDIEPGEVVSGSPQRAHSEWLRIEASLARLPELVKRVRELEKEVCKLKDKK